MVRPSLESRRVKGVAGDGLSRHRLVAAAGTGRSRATRLGAIHRPLVPNRPGPPGKRAEFNYMQRAVSETEALASGFRPSSSPNLPGLRRRILVVDDEPVTRRLNTKFLLRAGFEIVTADDGAIAWSILQCSVYDLILTDNAMPYVSGFELARSVRRSLMTLPIVMATGAVPSKELPRLAGLQPFVVLLKPYSPDELVATVVGALRAVDGISA